MVILNPATVLQGTSLSCLASQFLSQLRLGDRQDCFYTPFTNETDAEDKRPPSVF